MKDELDGMAPLMELSLFSGGGGGLLATGALGWRCLGAVEIDEDCCDVLERRRDEGGLCGEMEIWEMDIVDFNARGASLYRGKVDVISAGFPCQPFSVAGRQLASADPRNMWPATIECIRIVGPRFLHLENVPGLRSGRHGYLGRIFGDLASSGFDIGWRCLSAAELGAPHRRDRLWIVTDAGGPVEGRGDEP